MKYTLLWPEKSEFVRVAAKYNPTIVPFAAVGAEDSVEVVLDGKEVLGLPWLGEQVRGGCRGGGAGGGACGKIGERC